MLDVNAIRNKLTTDLEAFEREVLKVYDTLVIHHQSNEFNSFPHTLYGYMMRCFALIDLFSAYWQGDRDTTGQTRRMIDFMQRYMLIDQEACSVAVRGSTP